METIWPLVRSQSIYVVGTLLKMNDRVLVAVHLRRCSVTEEHNSRLRGLARIYHRDLVSIDLFALRSHLVSVVVVFRLDLLRRFTAVTVQLRSQGKFLVLDLERPEQRDNLQMAQPWIATISEVHHETMHLMRYKSKYELHRIAFLLPSNTDREQLLLRRREACFHEHTISQLQIK